MTFWFNCFNARHNNTLFSCNCERVFFYTIWTISFTFSLKDDGINKTHCNKIQFQTKWDIYWSSLWEKTWNEIVIQNKIRLRKQINKKHTRHQSVLFWNPVLLELTNAISTVHICLRINIHLTYCLHREFTSVRSKKTHRFHKIYVTNTEFEKPVIIICFSQSFIWLSDV